MPERWNRELRRLDRVDAPVERIKARAALGPSMEPGTELPPRRQRVMAGVVAFAVFIGAAAFAWQGFRSGSELPADAPPIKPPPATAVLDFDSSGDPAAMTLTFEGESLDTTPVAWDVCDETGNDCETATLDYDVDEFLPIPVGTPIVIEGDALDISGRFSLWRGSCDRDCKFPLRSSVPSVPGGYELLVDASFTRGQVTFSVGVQVYEPQPTAPVASMSFVGKKAPEGAIKFGGAWQDAVVSEWEWCDGSGGCEHQIVDFASYPPVEEFIEVPVGTLLSLAEPVRGIKAGFHTLEGKKASPTIEDQEHLGTVPTEPGKYAFQLHIALEGDPDGHGSATFWFGVEVVDQAATPQPPEADSQGSAVIPAEIADVLKVSCTPTGAKVLTPVVAARPDGVHLEIDDLSAVAESLKVRWGGDGRFRDSLGFGVNTLIVSIPPGAASLACVPVGEALLTWASFEVTDPG